MIEHIPRHRANVVPIEPVIGPVVNEFLQRLTYEQLFARYISVYKQFDQESRMGSDVNQLQINEIALAYPGLSELIEEMASTESNVDFADGVTIGAVAVLSVLKSTIEIQELNLLIREF